jgi:predicted ATPase
MKIKQLNIEGFRSLRNVSWLPGDLNVIIGPNGTGKSNLLRFIELVSVSAQGRLGKYIQSLGGMDPIVWDGVAASIKFEMETTPDGSELGLPFTRKIILDSSVPAVYVFWHEPTKPNKTDPIET